MKRLFQLVVAAFVLTTTLALPARGAAVDHSVKWVCDVPGEGLVTFVSVPRAAFHGISQANLHAGQTFHDRFGEVCTVVVA
jgi:hypothetical protein